MSSRKNKRNRAPRIRFVDPARLNRIPDPNLIDAEAACDATILKAEITKLLGSLRPRDRRIVELRYELGENSRYHHTIEETARVLHTSRNYVAGACACVILKLRRRVEICADYDILQSFLP